MEDMKMGIAEKIANAKKSNWVSEGISKSEVKTIVELAKISAQIPDVPDIPDYFRQSTRSFSFFLRHSLLSKQWNSYLRYIVLVHSSPVF